MLNSQCIILCLCNPATIFFPARECTNYCCPFIRYTSNSTGSRLPYSSKEFRRKQFRRKQFRRKQFRHKEFRRKEFRRKEFRHKEFRRKEFTRKEFSHKQNLDASLKVAIPNVLAISCPQAFCI